MYISKIADDGKERNGNIGPIVDQTNFTREESQESDALFFVNSMIEII